MHVPIFTLVALLGLTTAVMLPERSETTKRNTNVCPSNNYQRCCETNDNGQVVACVYPGNVGSMEEFKQACEEINEEERKERKKHNKRHEEEDDEEEEEGKKYRGGKQPMCCQSDNSVLGPTLDTLVPSPGNNNMCTNLEG